MRKTNIYQLYQKNPEIVDLEPYLSKAQRRQLMAKQKQTIEDRHAQHDSINEEETAVDIHVQTQEIDGYCQICFMGVAKVNLITMCNTCNHAFCKNCLNTHVQNCIKNFKDVKCPQQDCNSKMDNHGDYYRSLHKKLRKKYNNIKTFKRVSTNSQLRFCPGINCKDGIIELIPNIKKQQCRKCLKAFCLQCWMEYHESQCDKSVVGYLQDKFKYRKCPTCQMIVERTQGCNYMLCRCGIGFCYDCGGLYIGTHACGVATQLIVRPQPIHPYERVFRDLRPIFIAMLVFLGVMAIGVLLVVKFYLIPDLINLIIVVNDFIYSNIFPYVPELLSRYYSFIGVACITLQGLQDNYKDRRQRLRPLLTIIRRRKAPFRYTKITIVLFFLPPVIGWLVTNFIKNPSNILNSIVES